MADPVSKTDLEKQVLINEEVSARVCKIVTTRLRAGIVCPFCDQEKLDYNSLLQLVCPRCGLLETGAFT